jgi:ABC-type dipeptide/oligopeptide/nickel transport system permease subunit
VAGRDHAGIAPARLLRDAGPDHLRQPVDVERPQAEQLLEVAEFSLGGSGSIVAAGAARLGLRVALVALVKTPYSYFEVGVGIPYHGPSADHLLGLDSLGRDTLSRLMVGAQISLLVGIGTQVVVLLIGVPIGLAAGYFRGLFDQVVTFIINLFYGIPDLLVALTYLGTSTARPFTVVISQLVTSLGGGWQFLTAAAVLQMALPLAVFIFLQRYFVRGITSGSVKG